MGSGGFPQAPFWAAVGVPGNERGRRTDAALTVLPALIAGTATRLENEPGQPVVTLGPAANIPPILVGGGDSDVTLRRVVKYGDGWAPSLMAPETLASSTARLRKMAAERGRPEPIVSYGTHAFLGTEPESRSARDALVRTLIDSHGVPAETAATIPIGGGPAEVAERLAAYVEAGASHIGLSLDGGDWMRNCERLAEARALLT